MQSEAINDVEVGEEVSDMKMSGMDWVVWVLLFAGGLNWGLVGAFDFNLVESILGDSLSMIVYILVGLAAVWSLFGMFMKKDGATGAPTQ